MSEKFYKVSKSFTKVSGYIIVYLLGFLTATTLLGLRFLN